MTREDFIQIAKGYIGKITEDDKWVNITNKNRLITYYQSGEVCEDKVVRCEIRFDKRDQSLDGKEETYSLLGGFSYPPPIDKEWLLKALEKFGFQPKQKQEAVMISIQPKWVEKIVSGEKAIEDDGWVNWNPKKIWRPSSTGLGLKFVFDEVNQIYGKDFIKY